MKNIIHDDNGYVFESPDDGKTVYRRKFADYNKRECIKQGVETISELLNGIEKNVKKIKFLLDN